MKGGVIARAQMGDANASIPTPQPFISRPMFGAFGSSAHQHSLAFVSAASVAHVTKNYGLHKRAVAVKNCRSIGKKDMKLNATLPNIAVDPETYRVTVDGVHLTCKPLDRLPLAQLYNLF